MRSAAQRNAVGFGPDDVKRDAFARVFSVPVAAEQPCVFVELGVIEQLQAMVPATD